VTNDEIFETILAETIDQLNGSGPKSWLETLDLDDDRAADVEAAQRRVAERLSGENVRRLEAGVGELLEESLARSKESLAISEKINRVMEGNAKLMIQSSRSLERKLCPGCGATDGEGRPTACQQGCPVSYMRPKDGVSAATLLAAGVENVLEELGLDDKQIAGFKVKVLFSDKSAANVEVVCKNNPSWKEETS